MFEIEAKRRQQVDDRLCHNSLLLTRAQVSVPCSQFRKMQGFINLVLSRLQWYRMLFERTLKQVIVMLLKLCANIGVDLQLEIEALRNNIVSSKTFSESLERTFSQCDNDSDNALNISEFYCAILLLYHKLNKIPFTGKRSPPRKHRVEALFRSYVRKQNDTLPETMPKVINDQVENSQNNNEIWKIVFTVDNLLSLSSFFVGFQFLNVCFTLLLHIPFEFNFIVFFIQFVTFHLAGFSIITVQQILATRRDAESSPPKVMYNSQQSKKDDKQLLMTKETFLYLCQKHFSNLVFTELWRMLFKAVLIPYVAYHVKVASDILLSWILSFGSNEDTVSVPLSIVLSVNMFIFAFVIEPVSNSLMTRRDEQPVEDDGKEPGLITLIWRKDPSRHTYDDVKTRERRKIDRYNRLTGKLNQFVLGDEVGIVREESEQHNGTLKEL